MFIGGLFTGIIVAYLILFIVVYLHQRSLKKDLNEKKEVKNGKK